MGLLELLHGVQYSLGVDATQSHRSRSKGLGTGRGTGDQNGGRMGGVDIGTGDLERQSLDESRLLFGFILSWTFLRIDRLRLAVVRSGLFNGIAEALCGGGRQIHLGGMEEVLLL